MHRCLRHARTGKTEAPRTIRGIFVVLSVFVTVEVADAQPMGEVPPQLPPQTNEQARQAIAGHIAPTVSLTAPAPGAVYNPMTAVLLTANASASSPGREPLRVDFYANGAFMGAASDNPYAFTWNTVEPGVYNLTAVATDRLGAAATSTAVTVTINSAPAVSITSPANNAMFSAPATIVITASATDGDGTISGVDFFADGSLIGTADAPPYSITLTGVGQGSYSLSARATDNFGSVTESSPIAVTVSSAAAQIYFIHTDHLNTPRLIVNQLGQPVWRWENSDPFGNNVPNENPSGLGNFTCNLRLPGQYFDKETNLHYNHFRDYDPAIGRYPQSDPIGLAGGVNIYAYSLNNPISNFDINGLDATVTYFPGFPGHIGIAINSSNTVGLYPQEKGPRVAFCGTVAGVVAPDRQRQNPKYVAKSQSVTIKSALWQDQLMRERINTIQRNAPTYNLCVDQCTAFVANVLRAGGVYIYSSTEELTPLGLMQQLQGLYGK